MKKCAVVIPFYKKELSYWEQLSYKRTVSMLNQYEIFILEPENSGFHKSQSFHSRDVKEIFLPVEDFQNISAYNRLMLSERFYGLFRQFEYILIVQLDAMILHSNLDYFLNQDSWDYIGAPWVGFDIRLNKNLTQFLPWYRKFNLINRVLMGLDFWFVGNGGISLRRTESFRRVILQNTVYDLENFSVNEDNFWSFCASSIDGSFKVAPFSEAIKFAFETAPRDSFELNELNLPFACHAFEKHDFSFWKEKMKEIGII